MPAFTELSPSSLPPARLRVKRFDSQMRFSVTASYCLLFSDDVDYLTVVPLCLPSWQKAGVLLSSQFWPMWSKSRQGLGQLPIGRTTLSG